MSPNLEGRASPIGKNLALHFEKEMVKFAKQGKLQS